MLIVTVDRRARRRLWLVLSVVVLLALARYALGPPGQLVVGHVSPLRHVDTREPKVALTFDISWGDKVVGPVLDILKAHRVRSTIFVSGGWSAGHPEILRRMVTESHEVGSHGHRHLNYSQYSREVVAENLRTAHQIIKDVCGVEPTLFRPPNGDYSDDVIATAAEFGYATVIWDTDSLDWKNPGVDFMVKRVLAKAHPGDIVLLHCSDSARQTAEALPRIIEGLRAQGFELVTVGELLRSTAQ